MPTILALFIAPMATGRRGVGGVKSSVIHIKSGTICKKWYGFGRVFMPNRIRRQFYKYRKNILLYINQVISYCTCQSAQKRFKQCYSLRSSE